MATNNKLLTYDDEYDANDDLFNDAEVEVNNESSESLSLCIYHRACRKLGLASIPLIEKGLQQDILSIKDACLKEQDLLALSYSLKVK